VEMGVDKISKEDETLIPNEAAIPQSQKVKKATPQEDETFFVAEEMPTFNGKEASLGMREFVTNQLKYPEEAFKKGIQGTVYVQFIVEKDGSVSNVKVLRGVSPELNKEAVRVTSLAQGWTPGKQKGKPVRVSFTFPIKFMLSDDKVTIASKSKTKKGEELLFVCEDMPTYNGKEAGAGFREYVAKHLKYPEEAAKKGIQGTVYIQFIVEKDGSVSNVKVLRGVDPSLDMEAMNVVKNAEKWEPGKQKGQAVRVSFTFPVKFQLAGKTGELIKGEIPNNALVLINGKEFKGDINTISPDFIKQITIMKDQSSIAKYGEKGKNGVIEITLKEGSEKFIFDEVVVTSLGR